MKLSKIQQIIKEEVAKAVSEIDHNREIERKFEKAVGIEPKVGGPGNKSKNFEVYIPSLEIGDANSVFRSKDKINSWIEKFQTKYGEEPKLKKIEDKYENGTRIIKIDVLNQAFKDWRDEYESTKSQGLEKYKNID